MSLEHVIVRVMPARRPSSSSASRISERVNNNNTCRGAPSGVGVVIESTIRVLTDPETIPRGVSMVLGASTPATSIRAQMNDRVSARWDAPLISPSKSSLRAARVAYLNVEAVVDGDISEDRGLKFRVRANDVKEHRRHALLDPADMVAFER